MTGYTIHEVRTISSVWRRDWRVTCNRCGTEFWTRHPDQPQRDHVCPPGTGIPTPQEHPC